MRKNRMVLGFIYFFLVPILSSYSHSRSGGVMLSSVELDAIGLRKTPGLKNGEIRLDGILYQSPNEWTVWLNGQPCTPKNHPEGIAILEVSPHSVEFKQTEKKRVEDSFDEDNGEEDEDDSEDEIELLEEEKVYNLTINQVIRLH